MKTRTQTFPGKWMPALAALALLLTQRTAGAATNIVSNLNDSGAGALRQAGTAGVAILNHGTLMLTFYNRERLRSVLDYESCGL